MELTFRAGEQAMVCVFVTMDGDQRLMAVTAAAGPYDPSILMRKDNEDEPEIWIYRDREGCDTAFLQITDGCIAQGYEFICHVMVPLPPVPESDPDRYIEGGGNSQRPYIWTFWNTEVGGSDTEREVHEVPLGRGTVVTDRALVCKLQRPNGATVLVGVTSTPGKDGKFVLIRHEIGLLTDIELYPSTDRCDFHLLEWINLYEDSGYLFFGWIEIPISSLVLYSDEIRWAKHVLLEGNNTLRMSA